MSKRLEKLLILTGEASADEHAAKLVTLLLQKVPYLEIHAVGGHYLTKTGITILSDHSQMGALGSGILKKIPYHLQLEKKILAHIATFKPDAVLMLDYGSFHLRLLKKIRAQFGQPIKLFYYILPQVWASRPWRIKRIAETVDKAFGILPFEQKMYDANHINYQFVGNPLIEELSELKGIERSAFLTQCYQPENVEIVGVFPGSRQSEVTTLLPEFLKAAQRLVQQFPKKQFFFPLVQAPSIPLELLESLLKTHAQNLNVKVITDLPAPVVLKLCKTAWVASGTVSLQAALVGTPVVSAYKTNRFLFELLRPLVLVKHFALPNLLCDERLIPELFNQTVTTQNLCDSISIFLDKNPRRDYVVEKLSGIAQQLQPETSTSEAVALGMLSFFDNGSIHQNQS